MLPLFAETPTRQKGDCILQRQQRNKRTQLSKSTTFYFLQVLVLEKEFLALLNRVLWGGNGVADRPLRGKDLIVISTLIRPTGR